MKVVFVDRALVSGGAQRQLVNLACGLEARGVSAEIACFYAGDSLETEAREAGLRVTRLEKKGRWDIAGLALRLRRLLSDRAPDIVHPYMPVPNLLTTLACRRGAAGPRLVWGVRASDMDMRCYGAAARAAYRIEAATARYADRIIANSRAGARAAVARGFPEDRVSVVPNGIDTARFMHDRDLGSAMRAGWLGEAPGPLIGNVARLDPMKDHPTFLKAAAEIAAASPGARFVCLGGLAAPAYRQRLTEMADELGIGDRVVWAGACTDMPAALNALDLVVQSSAFGEGFPNALAEAMACGIPCVATDVGDTADIIGLSTHVVPPRASEALADAAMAALRSPQQNAPAGWRARIVENYTIDRLAERTEAVFSQVLSAPGTNG